MPLQHVVTDLSRIGPILARVPVRAVGACHHVRIAHECGDIRLCHVERCDAHIHPVADQIERGFRRKPAVFDGNLFQRSSKESLCSYVTTGEEQRTVTAAPTQILAHFRQHARPLRSIRDAGAQ